MQSLPEVIPGCRETRALRVLHHRVGFAFRSFRRDSSGKGSSLVTLAGTLANEVKSHLQGYRASQTQSRTSAAWPYRRKNRSKHCGVLLQQAQQSSACPQPDGSMSDGAADQLGTMVSTLSHPGATISEAGAASLNNKLLEDKIAKFDTEGESKVACNRVLKQHLSDESTWLDDAAPAFNDTISLVSNTRRIRRDRRRKAREHREHWEQQTRTQFVEAQRELSLGSASDSWAAATLNSLAECLQEDQAEEWDDNGLAQRGETDSTCSSNSCALGEIAVALEEGVASELPKAMLAALSDFCNTARDVRVQSLESIGQSIQLLEPKVDAIKTVNTELAEWQAPNHLTTSWIALRQWLITENSGPVCLLRELSEAYLECVLAAVPEADNNDTLTRHIDNIRFNIPHTCRRLLENLKHIQYMAEREKLRVEESTRTAHAHSRSGRADPSADRALRASVATMADNDLQRLLAQRLAGSRSS